jgi:hypothetical protein
MSGDQQTKLGWLAILAGVLGFVGFGLLVAALAAPPPAPETLRRSEDLFRWQDGGLLLQTLTMIPLTLGLHAWAFPNAIPIRHPITALGLASQLALALILLLRFANVTSDMLYMIPQGFVGLWLALFNTVRPASMPKATSWVGIVAGAGLVVVGVGALTYAALVAPRMFIGPLTDVEIDAQSWTMPNVVAHICMAAGTLLGRAIFPIWLLLAGKRLLSGRQAIAAN